jgi:hypothetical protein
MHRLHPGLIAGLLLTGAAAAPLAAAQEAETFIYSTYFYCDVAQQERADAIFEQVDKPANDAALADGTIKSWGWLVHNTGGQWRRGQYYSAPSIAALLAASEKINSQIDANAKNKALGKEFGTACRLHDDYIWHRVAGGGNAPGAAAFSVYYVCDSSREDQADELVKRVFAPVYDKMVADGKLTSWGWLEHVVGGEYRRLSTIRAKDRTALMAARAELVAAMRNDPLADAFNDICGSHTDYIWEVKFDRP